MIRLVVGHLAGEPGSPRVVMYDDRTNRALGPVFDTAWNAASFLAWIRRVGVTRGSGVTFRDPVGLTSFEIDDALARWRAEERPREFAGTRPDRAGGGTPTREGPGA